jgi:hypothetical protein
MRGIHPQPMWMFIDDPKGAAYNPSSRFIRTMWVRVILEAMVNEEP